MFKSWPAACRSVSGILEREKSHSQCGTTSHYHVGAAAPPGDRVGLGS